MNFGLGIKKQMPVLKIATKKNDQVYYPKIINTKKVSEKNICSLQ